MISYPPASERAIGPDVVTTANASGVNAIGLAANPNRARGSFVINYSTKIAYVTQDGTAATRGRPSIAIPANGGVLQLSNQGATNIIFAANAVGQVEFHEFSYETEPVEPPAAF